MRRALATLTVLVCAGALASCGDSESDGGLQADPTEPKVIEVTIEGETVTPNGERVEVATGQDVELRVTADVAGEIHVHAEPEQELEYEAGDSTLVIEGIDQPGTVEVETHDPARILVQLEVS